MRIFLSELREKYRTHYNFVTKIRNGKLVQMADRVRLLADMARHPPKEKLKSSAANASFRHDAEMLALALAPLVGSVSLLGFLPALLGDHGGSILRDALHKAFRGGPVARSNSLLYTRHRYLVSCTAVQSDQRLDMANTADRGDTP